MRPMLRFHVSALGLALALATATRSSEAQPAKPPPGQRDRSNSQFMLRRGDAGQADAQLARSRARAGDCAGAIAAFDSAISHNIEPSMRRDRGLCHEKLGNVFPAIEDYRAYLVDAPEAPDAEQFRQRLAALEEQAGVSSPSTTGSDENLELGSGDQRATYAVDGEGAGEVRTTKKSRKKKRDRDRDGSLGDGSRSYDYYVEQERRADEAESSPLREGKGFIIGPYLNLPRFFFSDQLSKQFAYNVGATFRYSTGRLLTITSEVGYAGIGTANQLRGASGVSLMGGLELRLPISRFATDQILLRGGVGFEHQVASGTRTYANFLEGRFAAGYRRIIGSRVGLELLVDGGPVVVYPESGDSATGGVFGASFALTFGF